MSKATLYLVIVFIALICGDIGSQAQKICQQCSGINCQRSTYNNTETCQDALDVCATVFEGQSVQAQGCFLELPAALRLGCESRLEGLNCYTCSENLCNNNGQVDYECVECDSNTNSDCMYHPEKLQPVRCPIAKAPNSLCFVSDDGKRTIRGCSTLLPHQRSCFGRQDCLLCSPTELSGCNRAQIIERDEGASGSGSGGSGSGSGSGGSGSGSGSGGSGSGSGSGSGGSGSGSGSGGSGSGSGSGSGGSGSGSGSGGSGSGSGSGGSGSGSEGSGSGSGSGGSGSGSGSGGSGSGSGSGGSGSGSGGSGSGSSGSESGSDGLSIGSIIAIIAAVIIASVLIIVLILRKRICN